MAYNCVREDKSSDCSGWARREERLPVSDQEGRRGSEEAVPGPSVFPSGEPGVSGDFWGSLEGCQGPSRPSGRNRGLPLRRRRVFDAVLTPFLNSVIYTLRNKEMKLAMRKVCSQFIIYRRIS